MISYSNDLKSILYPRFQVKDCIYSISLIRGFLYSKCAYYSV